jgi:regulatory protein YycI of two-component signal transduction system YycFG
MLIIRAAEQLTKLGIEVPSLNSVTPISLDYLTSIKTYAEEHNVDKCIYLFSTYRLEEPQKAHTFQCNLEHIRVSSDNTIIAEYTENKVHNGKTYDLAAKDADGNYVEYYIATPEGYSKYNSISGELVVETVLSPWDSIPEDKKEIFKDFPHKDRVFGWSDKSTGFVLHYVEP